MTFQGEQENTAVPNAVTQGGKSMSDASASSPSMKGSHGDATTADGQAAMHPKHQEWLTGRGIDPALAAKFGIITTQDGGGNWLTVPYLEDGQRVTAKHRLTREKNHRMDAGAPLTLWNRDVLLSDEVKNGAKVIVTEGEWDALVSIQCGFRATVSVPNGAPAEATENPLEQRRYEFIQRNKALLDDAAGFVLATDADAAGRALAADLARLLGPERCWFVTYPDGCKDLNEVLLKHGEPSVVDTLNYAKPYPVRGLYKFEDFPEPPPVQKQDIHIEGLDQMFPLVPGTFTLITGYAGQGKTSLLLVMLAKLLKAGVPMAMASFETMVKPILLRRLRSAIYGCPEYSDEALKAGPADALLAQKMDIIAHSPDSDEDELTLSDIIELGKISVLRNGTRLLVIDPWNEIEHKRGDASETDYTGTAIRALKRFAKNYDCAVWLVAHPRKPQADGKPRMPSLYDLAGSANFANKADYGLVVHRRSMESTEVDFRVSKVRMGLPGQMGTVTLNWDAQTNDYKRVNGYD